MPTPRTYTFTAGPVLLLIALTAPDLSPGPAAALPWRPAPLTETNTVR
ncbi:hypothetical protein [Streptomyces sp. NPDC002588]